MKEEYGIRLVKKELLGETCAVLTFFCPEIALSAKPGQFVNLSCSYFLKRPFGIMSVDRDEKTFSIGVRKGRNRSSRQMKGIPLPYWVL